jgi:hypothetical protein
VACRCWDVTTPHTCTAIRGQGEIVIGCQGKVLRGIPQSRRSPLLLMVDLFEVGPPGDTYPETAVVHHVRGWQSSC